MLLGFHGSGFNEFFLGFGFLGVVGLWGFAARERESGVYGFQDGVTLPG